MEWIATLTPEADPDPLSALAAPPAGAALVELRLDLFPGLDPSAAVSACPLPLLATLRSIAEGGRGPTDPAHRDTLLTKAYEAGASLLDLELERDADLLASLGLEPERVVLSWHDPEATPGNLCEISRRLLDTPARLVKMVPYARSLADLGRVLELHCEHNAGPPQARRLIAFAMGTVGLASRYLAPLLGPAISFAAWNADAPAAPGQLPIARLEAAVGHLTGPPQGVFGIVGADVSPSLSPVLHGAAFRALGLPYAMLPLSVPEHEELTQVFAPPGATFFDRLGLRALGYAVTTPYKRRAAEAATLIAPRVTRAQAANTLLLRGDRLIADTTDADGVVGGLRHLGLDPAGTTAIVQGTGGASRAAAVGLDLAGANVVLRGRDPQRTGTIASSIGVEAWSSADASRAPLVLVNGTPLGSLRDDPSPFPPEEVQGAEAVVDMVYREHETALAELARAADVPLVDGREMLLQQGYAQVAAFTGAPPPREAMRAAVMVFAPAREP